MEKKQQHKTGLEGVDADKHQLLEKYSNLLEIEIMLSAAEERVEEDGRFGTDTV